MLALRDPGTQKRGMVGIGSYMDEAESRVPREKSFDGNWKAPKLLLGIPIHIAAVHIGYNSIVWAPVHAIMRMTFSFFTRIRFRCHYGRNSVHSGSGRT